jgi:hypothetical protein
MAEERPESIRESTWRELLALRDALERQGGIYPRSGRPDLYRIRVRVWQHVRDGSCWDYRRRQLSIAIRGERAAEAVRHLLAYWRLPAGREEWRKEKIRRAIREQKRLWRENPDQIDRLHGEALAEDRARSGESAPVAPAAVQIHRPEPSRQQDGPPQMTRNLAADDILSLRHFPRSAEKIYHTPENTKDDPVAVKRDQETYEEVRRRADAGWRRLPIWLKNRLVVIKDALAHHGTIVARREKDRRGGYRVRVRVPHPRYGRVHVAVPVPEEHVMDVWAVMLLWRAPELMAKARQMRLERKLRRERAQTKQGLRLIKILGEDHEIYRDTLDQIKFLMCMQAGVPPFMPVECLPGHAKDASG